MTRLKNKYGWLWCALILMMPVMDGCKVKRPKEVLSETQMEKLLYDYHIAKAMGEDLPYDENYKRQFYLNYVFQKHGTTEEVFDSSMVWYTRHTDVFVKVYGKVNKLLKNQQEDVDRLIALHDRKPQKSASGDSVDVWAERRVYALTGYPLNNKITFSLPSDENFKKRDSLSWEVRYHFFRSEPVDSTAITVMSMQIVYNNDSVVSAIKKVSASGKEYIGLKSDSLDIKEIRGFIYSPKRDTLGKGLLLLDSIVLMRYHANDTIPGIEIDKENLKEEEKPAVSSQPIQPEKEKPEEQNQRRIERPRPSATKTDSKKDEK